MSAKIKRLPTDKVYSLWRCPECRRTARWDFQDVQNSGSPVCTHCDCDMEFTGKVFVIQGKQR